MEGFDVVVDNVVDYFGNTQSIHSKAVLVHSGIDEINHLQKQISHLKCGKLLQWLLSTIGAVLLFLSILRLIVYYLYNSITTQNNIHNLLQQQSVCTI